MGRSFHPRVHDENEGHGNLRDEDHHDENLCDKNAGGENVHHEAAGDEGNFSDWKFSAGVICGGVWRGKFDFYSYANAHANAAGKLFAGELERDVCVHDERHG